MSIKRQMLSEPGLADALKDREIERLLAMKDVGLAGEDDGDDPVYQLAMKKRRMTALLQKAMREAGYGDLSKQFSFRKATEDA